MVRCNRVLVFVNGVPVSSHDLPLLSNSKLSLATYEPCLFSVSVFLDTTAANLAFKVEITRTGQVV